MDQTTTLSSSYNDDEMEFLDKKAAQRGMNLEQYQKFAALNSGKKRHKDKVMNEKLTEISTITLELETAILNGGKRAQVEIINKLKGKLGGIQCSK